METGPGRTCVVKIRDANGHSYARTTVAASLYEAVRNAIAFFERDYWQGPKPNAGTVFEVTVVGEQRTYRVSAADVMVEANGRNGK